MRDGLYQVTSDRYRFCAGFVIHRGQPIMMAHILRRSFPYWATLAKRIGD